MNKLSNLERVAEKLFRNQPKAKPFGMFFDGHFNTGTQSLHRTTASRMYRTILRIRGNRK